MHIFSPTLVNELKFGFNRGNVYTTNQGHDQHSVYRRSLRVHHPG